MKRSLSIVNPSIINVATRDYGLMRVDNERSSTPFPRKSKAIDGETLRIRLDAERHRDQNSWVNTDDEPDTLGDDKAGKSDNELSDTLNTPNSKKKSLSEKSRVLLSVKKLSSNRSSISHNLLSIGTPHPIKDIALNPKMLSTRISTINEALKVQELEPHVSRTSQVVGKPKKVSSKRIDFEVGPKVPSSSLYPRQKRLTGWRKYQELSKSEQSLDVKMIESNNELATSSFTPIEIKSAVSGLKSILKKVSEKAQKSDMKLHKKVNLIIPKTSWKNKTLPTTATSTMTFAERRRLFNEAEFSICKNGSPLNDLIMGIPDDDDITLLERESSRQDIIAIRDFKKIMRNHGFISSTGHRISF